MIWMHWINTYFDADLPDTKYQIHMYKHPMLLCTYMYLPFVFAHLLYIRVIKRDGDSTPALIVHRLTNQFSIFGFHVVPVVFRPSLRSFYPLGYEYAYKSEFCISRANALSTQKLLLFRWKFHFLLCCMRLNFMLCFYARIQWKFFRSICLCFLEFRTNSRCFCLSKSHWLTRNQIFFSEEFSHHNCNFLLYLEFAKNVSSWHIV